MIKQRRAEMGISQRKLATRVGVSDACIARLETRERTNPSLDVLRRLQGVEALDRGVGDMNRGAACGVGLS